MNVRFKICIWIIISFLVLQTGCTKTEYLIEKPDKPISNTAPKTFSVSADIITDTEVRINWDIPTDEENDLKSFEIGVNDSIIVYDLSTETKSYLIQNLQPNIEYKLSIVATDEANNISTASTIIKTLKSFIKNIFKLELGYESFSFGKAIETSDGGFLIEGLGTTNHYVSPTNYFIIKLKSDYSVEWKKEFPEWYASASTYAPQAIAESEGKGYLVTHTHALTRLDASGNIQWTYKLPEEYKSTLVSSNFDLASDLISVGNSDRDWPDGPISLEYFVIKISSNGSEQWHRYGGHSIVNYPHRVYVQKDNSILVTGVAESTGSQNYAENHNWINSFWTVKLNETGEELSQKLYPNEGHNEDILLSSYLSPNGNILLMGAYGGYLPPYGLYNTFPRVLKIDPNGDIVWDILPRLSGNYAFSTFWTYDTIEDEKLLVLGNDDRGVSLNMLAPDGNVSEIVSLRNYPSMVLIKNNTDGFYELISSDGYVIICDKEGYVPEKQ